MYIPEYFIDEKVPILIISCRGIVYEFESILKVSLLLKIIVVRDIVTY